MGNVPAAALSGNAALSSTYTANISTAFTALSVASSVGVVGSRDVHPSLRTRIVGSFITTHTGPAASTVGHFIGGNISRSKSGIIVLVSESRIEVYDLRSMSQLKAVDICAFGSAAAYRPTAAAYRPSAAATANGSAATTTTTTTTTSTSSS
eukprot:Lankesteria_metandrocarpae@DN7114_c0_g1_i1.p1